MKLRPWIAFRRQRRAYFSAIALLGFLVVSLGAELVCNNRPYLLRHHGQWYFPLFRDYSASEFGDEIRAIPDYKKLVASREFKRTGGIAVFPPIQYGENESAVHLSGPPPTPPDRDHWLGTDDRGRDLLTRLIYGFRNSFLFGIGATLLSLLLATVFGGLLGFLGGRWDFFGQRMTEAWSTMPILYLFLFMTSVLNLALGWLVVLGGAFGWIPLAGYLRSEALRLKRSEFVLAARALGIGTPRVFLSHVLPNALAPVISMAPLTAASAIASLAALDYLGFGLPPPTASWGELLKQGKENLSSWWLSGFPFLSLFALLLALHFVGEGIHTALVGREGEALDGRRSAPRNTALRRGRFSPHRLTDQQPAEQ